VHRDVRRAEEEKGRVQREIAALQERLSGLTTELQGKLQARAEYDRTIRETEAAYSKIVESSETLLRVLRREATHLQQHQQQAQAAQQHQHPPKQQQGGQGAASSLLVNSGAVTGAGHSRRAGE
jgi:sjoegren syndrome nuclear autoantigen 1